jgi:O-acetylhomoserine/O-acetylserine sulfhydrylase
VGSNIIQHRFLERHPKVAWVSYLGLQSHDSHQLALELVKKNAYGGVLSFGVKGDAPVAMKVIDNLKLASNLANVGAYASSVPNISRGLVTCCFCR